MYAWFYQGNHFVGAALFAMLLFFVVFTAVFAWAYWPRRHFDDAAHLPLEGDQ